MTRYPYPSGNPSLTQEEVTQLLEHLRRHAPRLIYLVAWTQYELAGRIREVLHLAAVDLGENYVHLRRFKGSNDSRITPSAELMHELHQLKWENEGSRSAYLFVGNATCRVERRPTRKKKDRITGEVYEVPNEPFPCSGRHIGASTIFKHVQAAGRAIGLDHGLCKTHVLRHSAITHEAEINRDEPLNVTIRRGTARSGHKNLQHYLTYLNNPREDREYIQHRAAEVAKVTALSRRVELPAYGVEVDEFGSVYRDGKRLLIRYESLAGRPYPYVTTPTRERLEIHGLMADAFLGKRRKGHVVRHLDDDPFHTHRGNLRYGTRKQNWADRTRKKLPPCRQCEVSDAKHYSNPCTFCSAPDAVMVGQAPLQKTALGNFPAPAFACSDKCREKYTAWRLRQEEKIRAANQRWRQELEQIP